MTARTDGGSAAFPGLPALSSVPLGAMQYTMKARVEDSVYWVAGPALPKCRPPSEVPRVIEAKAPGPIVPQLFRGSRAQQFRDMALSSRFVKSHSIPGHLVDSVASSLSSVPSVAPSGLGGHYVYQHVVQDLEAGNETINLDEDRDEF